MRRLTKREIESLLESYDRDPVASLSRALCSLLQLDGPSWPEIVPHIPTHVAEHDALLRGDLGALDLVTKHLVENRAL